MTELKVGELARRAGISVRTLHYYDEIGLLPPSQHSRGKHRLYAAADIARLQQIRSLREVGLSLGEIAGCLAQPEFSLRRVLALHTGRVREQLDRQRELVYRLEALSAALRRSRKPPLEQLLAALEGIARVERYFTPADRERMAERARGYDDAAARLGQAAWQDLLDEVRAAMAQGENPKGRIARRLAERWRALVREFTGGDTGISRGLQRMWETESSIHGHETKEIREMWTWLAPSLQSLRAVPAKG